jgi:hypothetical protein
MRFRYLFDGKVVLLLPLLLLLLVVVPVHGFLIALSTRFKVYSGCSLSVINTLDVGGLIWLRGFCMYWSRCCQDSWYRYTLQEEHASGTCSGLTHWTFRYTFFTSSRRQQTGPCNESILSHSSSSEINSCISDNTSSCR